MMEEKLLHAEFKREVQLQAIVKKAQEEEAKVSLVFQKMLFVFPWQNLLDLVTLFPVALEMAAHSVTFDAVQILRTKS